MTTPKNAKGAFMGRPSQKQTSIDARNYNPTTLRPQTFAAYGIELPAHASVNVRTTCPQCSATRKKARDKCLSVNTSDGVWHCHHCHWSGTLKQRKTYTAPTVAGVTQAQINHALIARELMRADRARGVTHGEADLKAIATAAQVLMKVPDAQRKLSAPLQGEKVDTSDEALRRTVDALRVRSPASWVCLACEGRDHG